MEWSKLKMRSTEQQVKRQVGEGEKQTRTYQPSNQPTQEQGYQSFRLKDCHQTATKHENNKNMSCINGLKYPTYISQYETHDRMADDWDVDDDWEPEVGGAAAAATPTPAANPPNKWADEEDDDSSSEDEVPVPAVYV